MKKNLIIILLSSFHLFANEMHFIDFGEKYGTITSSNLQIFNDTLTYITSNNRYIIATEEKMDSIEYPLIYKPRGISILNTNLFYFVSEDGLKKYTDGNWVQIDSVFGPIGVPTNFKFPYICYNNNTNEILLGITLSNIYLVKDEKIRKVEAVKNGIEFMGTGMVTYLNDNFYYFNNQSELLQIDDNDAIIRYNRDDYYSPAGKLINGINPIHYLLDNPNNDQIWFSTAEGNLISFDGETFENHNYLKNGPLKDEMALITAFNFDNDDNLWLYTELLKDSLFEDKGVILRFRYDYNLYKFNKSDNYTTWEEINYQEVTDFKSIYKIEVDRSNRDNKKVYLTFPNSVVVYDNTTGVETTESRTPTLFFRSIYPNPSMDYINIEFASIYSSLKNINVEVYNIAGFKVLDEKLEITSYNAANGYGNCHLNTSSLQNGIYLILISDGITSRYSKFVVSRR